MDLKGNDFFPIVYNQEELLKIQRYIASEAIVYDKFRFDEINTIAGVDQAFFDDKIVSGLVILDYDSLEPMEKAYSMMHVEFPYIPGFLTFREGPVIINVFRRLKTRPDLLMVDGCGINHPRFAGLATHIGVSLNVPTIGVAKKVLCGEYDKIPEEKNDYSILSYENRDVGALFKSKKNCNPIIIAPGHRISLSTSIKIVMHCLRGYKLPEPTRLAHSYVNGVKKSLHL
jgi:deoxyribonuclease V